MALFCYQAKKWIGSFAAALGGLDTLVFAGGIGENAPLIRERICDGLGFLGIELNQKRNAKNAPLIKASSTKARSPSGVCTTMLGRKRRASKRPCGYSSRNRSSVAVVSRWTTAVSKNVPSGSVKSVTASLCSRPSISGQYSSALAVELSAREGAARSRRWRLAAWNLTLRESARDRIG